MRNVILFTVSFFLRVTTEPVLDAQFVQILLDVGLVFQVERHRSLGVIYVVRSIRIPAESDRVIVVLFHGPACATISRE